MQIEFDPDVKAAAEFMQANFAAPKLVPISEALCALAPILWGRYGREGIQPLALVCDASSAVEQAPKDASQ